MPDTYASAETKPVSIALACVEDTAEIERVRVQSLADVPEGVYTRRQIDAIATHPKSDVELMIRQGRYFVALHEGRIVGSAGWMPDASDQHAAVIRAVFVDPGYQGLGVGRRIIQTVEDAAVTAGFVKIVVPAAMTARGFYRRLGYSEGRIGLINLSGTPAPYMKMEKHVSDCCWR